MPKKIKVEEAVVGGGGGGTVENFVSELTTDFGRADLNELSAKLNEVIRKINR